MKNIFSKGLLFFNSIGVIFILVCFISINVFSQTVILWEKGYGGSGSDFGKAISKAPDGDFYLGGYTNSSDGDISGVYGGMDVFVMRIDSFGNIKWQKNYGGSGNDFIHGLLSTKDGGAIIEAYTVSNDLPGFKGGYDILLIKIDEYGNIEWQRLYGGSDNDGLHAVDVKEHPNGGYIMTASTESADGDISWNKGAGDSWLVRLSNTGNIIWEKTFGGSSDEDTHCVLITSDTNYIVAGHTFSTDGDVSGLHGAGFDDGWIYKTDSSGNMLWSYCYGGTNVDIFSSACEVAGNFFFAGYTSSNDGDIISNKGIDDGWIIKTDADGNILWSKTYGGTQGDYFSNIFSGYNNTIAICGLTNSNDGDVYGNKGNFDYWILIINQDGNILTRRCAGGPLNDRGEFIYPVSDSAWLVTGFSNSTSGEISHNQGFNDAWTLELKLVDCSSTVADFEYHPFSPCVNEDISIINLSANADSSVWYINNIYYSSLMEPGFVFTKPQKDTITLIVFNGVCTDTVFKIIENKPLPEVFLGSDTAICAGCSILLDAGNPDAIFSWSTGETTQQINFSQQPDTVIVEVNLNGCFAYDTIVVGIINTNAYECLYNDIKIFPNPAYDVINIEVDRASSDMVSYRILNINGTEIIKGKFERKNNTIDISMIPQGTYILEINTEGNYYRKILLKLNNLSK